MNKPRFVISSPFDTYSGYGARSRDIIKSIIKSDKYQVELLSQRWGDTSWGFCKDNPEWAFLLSYLAKREWQQTPVDYWIQISIPNEFQPVGKFNIGVTAGIESDQTKPEWIEGLNRMNMNWVSSNHAKSVFENFTFKKIDKRTNQNLGILKSEKPIEVVFEGANLDTYKTLDKSTPKNIDLSDIKESFCYLFVGHWMQGSFGHDRKNVGVLVKEFYETFKDIKGNKPALILKSSTGTSSYISREEILNRISKIKRNIKSKNLPNIYLLHGDFTDKEMNELYNNSKVKAMVSTTKGEGFGRPLLEFSTTGKPIIASGWSGHIDFLNSSFTTLLKGRLEKVHPSAANDWLIAESKWFQVDVPHLKSSLKAIYKKYKAHLLKSKQQKQYVKTNFSWEKMHSLIHDILDDEKKVPKIAKQVELNLPKLNLPKLKKV